MGERGRIQPFAFLLPLALTAFVFTPVAAQESTRAKETYFATDPSVPELANDYLRMHPGDAIEIVSFNQAGKDPVQNYYAFGPTSRSPQGVCRFTATQIFPHRSDDGKISWDSMPPRPSDRVEPPFTMAILAGNSCPRQSEDVYSALDNGVSDAEFVTISNFWRDISGSQEKFDQASVLLPLIVSPRAAERFSAFRSAVFRPGGEPVQLRAVFRGGVDAYNLAFADSLSEPPNYFLSISKSAAGFTVLNFQTRY